jgi:hypothetical protein
MNENELKNNLDINDKELNTLKIDTITCPIL